MLAFFRKLFGERLAAEHTATETAPDTVRADFDPVRDLAWLYPPSTVADPMAWDQYWRDQISHDVAGFVHWFCDDGELIDVMRTHGLKTVLCIGNGISQEPRALARAGFDVTALDLSPYASEVARTSEPPEELLIQLVGGRSPAPQGKLKFAVGDLCDVTTCPGPFDVVIERKTLQLFKDADRPRAMQAVANRLTLQGIFFSHSHNGGWRPPAPRTHPLTAWFRDGGWQFWDGSGNTSLTGRVAWLFLTTG